MMELDLNKIKEELYRRVEAFSIEIEPVYKALNWEWALVGVPNRSDIAKTLRELIRDMQLPDMSYDNPFYSISTGGLTVGYELIKENGMLRYIDVMIKFKKEDQYTGDILNYMKDTK